MSDSLQPLEMQHSRPPCPSLSPRVCSKPWQLSQWCYCIISSSAALFSFCLLSFIASGSFQMSQLFASDDQSILELQLSISPSNEYSELISFRIDWFDLLAVQGTHKSLLQHHSTSSSGLSFLYGSAVTSVHDFWKSNSFDYGPLLARWCLCILICSLGLSQLFFQGKLGISWQQSLFAVILETKERQSVTVSTFSPSIFHEAIWLDAMILVFWMLGFKPDFSFFSFTLKRLFSSSTLSAIWLLSSAYLKLLIFFPRNLDFSLCSFQPGVSHDVLCI